MANNVNQRRANPALVAITRLAIVISIGLLNGLHMHAASPDFLARNPIRDVAKAKKLLAEAGYANGITLPTFHYAPYYPELGRVMQVAAESVKEAGITARESLQLHAV